MAYDPSYGTPRWKQLRRRMKIQAGNRCSISGCTNDQTRLHVDHIVEADDGGPFWDEANLQVLCKPHHDAKTRTVAAGRGMVRSPNA